MPAFGRSVITPNGTFDPSKDKATRNTRSLILTAMYSPAALPGTTGTHTSVITGDCQKKVSGSSTVNIDHKWAHTVAGNVIFNFKKNWTKTVHSNDTLKVLGNLSALVHGHETITVLGPTLEHKVGEHTQVHQTNEHNQDLTEITFHKLFVFDKFLSRVEVDSILVNIFAAHGDFVGYRLTAGLKSNELFLAKTEVKELKETIAELRTDVDWAKEQIGFVQDTMMPTRNRLDIYATSASGLKIVHPQIITNVTFAQCAAAAGL